MFNITKKLNSYDLHCHTIASDGNLTSTEIVVRAIENGVDVLAITDHDTTEGLNEAHQKIKDDNLPLILINGVEISTTWRNQEIHIVGLNIDSANADLQALLTHQEEYRIERAKEISARLARVSIPNAYEGAKEYAKGNIVSRAHFGQFLVNAGFAKDIKRAFKKYLGKSGYAYVSPMWCTIEQAIDAIHNAGGQVVLAHPSRYLLTNTKLNRLMAFFKSSGGDAIEVSQSRQTMDDLNMLTKLALKYELLASQGSDFHYDNTYLNLGQTTPLPSSVTPIWHDWQLEK